MWKLTNKNTGSEYFLFPSKEKIAVGKQGDFILTEDSSISRTHASLNQVSRNLFLIDEKSKYGTYLNENIAKKQPVAPKEVIQIQENDTIRFGLLQNEWVVNFVLLTTATSALTAQEKKSLKPFLSKYNIDMKDTFDDSITHLTVNNLSITIKVLQALVKDIPIVNSKYWKSFIENIKASKFPPAYDEYFPKIDNDFLKNIDFKAKRKGIFNGKIFLFMNKTQMDNFGSVIQLAGGKVKELNRQVAKSVLLRNSVILVQFNSQSQSQCHSQTVDDIVEFLHENDRRLIPDHEIGLAIVSCSTEKYCNPRHKIISGIIPETENGPSLGTELAAETPVDFVQSSDKQVLEIPDSDEDRSAPQSSNRRETRSRKAKSPAAKISLQIDDSDDEIIGNLLIPGEKDNKKRKASPSIHVKAKSQKTEAPSKHPTLLDLLKLKPKDPPSKQNEESFQQFTNENPKSSTQKFSTENSESTKKSDDVLGPNEELIFESESQTQQKRKLPSIIDDDGGDEFTLPKRKTQKLQLKDEIRKSEDLFKSSETQSQSKRKLNLIEDNSDDDENLFSSAKRRTNRLQAADGFSIELDGSSNNSEGFISRSQKSSLETTNRPKEKKKLKLFDGSGEDDDSFTFGKKRKKIVDTNDDVEFVFDKSQKKKDDIEDPENTAHIIKRPAVMKFERKEIKQEYKVEPLKFSLDGWLSSSMFKVKLEEDSVHDSEDVKTESEEWIDSIRNNIKVEVLDCSTFIKTKSSINMSNTSSAGNISNQSINGKNYKKFVKSTNFKPQTRVINTIAFHVNCSDQIF